MSEPARIAPIVDEVTRPFWDAAAEERLVLPHCAACDRAQWPPRGTCRRCGGPLAWREASGRGTLFTFSIVRRSSHAVPAVPYVLAIVELEEGVHLTTNLVVDDPEAVRIGLPVTVAFEPLGGEDAARLPVFAPAA